MTSHFRRMRTVIVAALLVQLALVGCGGDEVVIGEPPPLTDEKALEHVHGIGVNPADKSLMIASHGGLYRVARAGEKPELVGGIRHDFMGFTVAGPDRLLASGHPAPGDEHNPPNLGLIESTDGGSVWQPVSMSGEADFHVLRVAGSRVYGFDSVNGLMMASTNSGLTWRESTTPAPLFDLAANPGNARSLIGVVETAVYRSRDGGRSWSKVDDQSGAVAWPAHDRLYLANTRGFVLTSANGGRSWRKVGELAEPPRKLHAAGRNELYAALTDTIVHSTDGGRTWQEFTRLP